MTAPLVLIAQVGSAKKIKQYAGPDAGCLIYSVGTIDIGMHFTFTYNIEDELIEGKKAVWSGEISPKVGGAWLLRIKNPDFSGKETGHVVVRCLPPGKYTVNRFSFSGSTPGVAAYQWTSAQPISMPFYIRSGQATYIGTFMRAPSLGTSLQPVLGAAGYFVVADRSARDLPIAMARLPAAMKIITEVTDVTKFGSEALRVEAAR